MPTQTAILQAIIKQAVGLTLESKKALAKHLLADVAEEENLKTQNMSEEEQRRLQRVKNQAALDFLKQLQEDTSGYEEENWPAIEEAINATIRK